MFFRVLCVQYVFQIFESKDNKQQGLFPCLKQYNYEIII